MIAIDLGSNTIRFIEFDGISWGKSFEKIVRTAQGLHETNNVNDEAVKRIVSAIFEAKNHLNFDQPIVGVATAAIRMSDNALSVLDQIFKETAIRFTIIDGNEEARLTLLAVHHRLQSLHYSYNQFCLFDIGGASTELTLLSDSFHQSISLDIGILTMSEKSLHGIPLETQLDDFETKILHFTAQVPSIETLVLSSGTPTTIAAYLLGMDYTSYEPEKVNGFILKLDQCYQVLSELLAMDENERSRYVGVGREELIITGILMVISVFRAIDLPSAIVVDDGLREGVALNYYFKDQFPDLT